MSKDYFERLAEENKVEFVKVVEIEVERGDIERYENNENHILDQY